MNLKRNHASQEWLPIKTAPTDGTWILATYPDVLGKSFMIPMVVYYANGFWRNDDPAIYPGRRAFGFEQPTHWCPLPIDPNGKEFYWPFQDRFRQTEDKLNIRN